VLAVYYILSLWYNSSMRASVQARLDAQARADLEMLVERLECSPSAVVRKALRVLAGCYGTPKQKRIIGLGQFASGIPDLASNKEHLKGFGRDAGVAGYQRDRRVAGPRRKVAS
jgi:hypothetical protein